MTDEQWKVSERLTQHQFFGQLQRDAYVAGYSDGYHGYRFNQSDWPQSYKIGFEDGYQDAGWSNKNV